MRTKYLSLGVRANDDLVKHLEKYVMKDDRGWVQMGKFEQKRLISKAFI